MVVAIRGAEKTKRIDPHVHFRDFTQSRVFTIKEGVELARSQRVVAVADMPNTNPPIITKEALEARLKLAESYGIASGYYVYIGATGNHLQLQWAFREATENPKVVGIKLYAGVSTGDLAVIDPEKQRLVYAIATKEGYRGILAVHCEEESLACPHNWNPAFPATWNSAKPPEMEIVGIANQIKFAHEEGYKGHLHIAHISTPEGVEMVSAARNRMSISCGSTPHHLTYYDAMMQDPSWVELKVNPPIRSKEMRDGLLTLLKYGKIDMIETDFAPHLKKVFDPLKPEQNRNIPSGIRSLNNYDEFLLQLRRQHGFSPDELERLTYANVRGVFRKMNTEFDKE